MANEMQPTKVITNKVRFSYLHVWEPAAVEGSDKPKYSVSLIIPKSDTKTHAAILKAIEAAKVAGKDTKFGGKIPAGLKTPLRDGDIDREDEAYANAWFINANCTTKPGLVDRDCNAILNQDELYSGCYGRASITFYPFNSNGNRGIACGLNHLQKLSDGEPLGSRSTAESDFAQPVEEEDDFLS